MFGKFIAGLTALAISLIVLWLLVIGLGLLMLGVPPGADEIGRALIFLGVTIVYAGVLWRRASCCSSAAMSCSSGKK